MSAPVNLFLRTACRSVSNICNRADHIPGNLISYRSYLTNASYRTSASQQVSSSDARPVDVAPSKKQFFFDTHALVKYLEGSGFTTEQAEGMADALMEIMNSHTDNQQKKFVTKAQQEVTVQQVMSHIASIKKDMVILEKSEFSMLRNETEKLHIELTQLRTTMKDELANMHGRMTLDINLERGRAKDDHAANEKNLSRLDNKVNTEAANLRTVFEQYRNDTIKYSVGAVLSCLTVALGFYRLWA